MERPEAGKSMPVQRLDLEDLRYPSRLPFVVPGGTCLGQNDGESVPYSDYQCQESLGNACRRRTVAPSSLEESRFKLALATRSKRSSWTCMWSHSPSCLLDLSV